MKNVKTKVGASVLGAVSMMAMQAHAELPTAATSAMSSISTGISDAEAAAWPVIGAALVAGIIIKLVKRFANKV